MAASYVLSPLAIGYVILNEFRLSNLSVPETLLWNTLLLQGTGLCGRRNYPLDLLLMHVPR